MKNLIGLLLWIGLAASVAAKPLDKPAAEVLTEARRIVHEMIESPRGPYSRILWFCNDGTTQPPVPYACRGHGGGRQHAQYSPARERLAALGWSVGTIYAALSFEELIGSTPRQHRLRELPLEQYLIDIDNGWVLQRARGYRGRVQVEDEERAGRALLERLFAQDGWLEGNFLLARELARVIPHGEETDLARSARRLAIELAELDPAAERWRAEIHSAPNAGTADRLRAWLAGRNDAAVRQLGKTLAHDLDRLYGATGRAERVAQAFGGLRQPPAVEWRRAVDAALGESGVPRIEGLCAALSVARSSVLAAVPPEARLKLIDAMQGVETEVRLSYEGWSAMASSTRGQWLRLGRALADCAYASGLLTQTERASLAVPLTVDRDGSVSLQAYRSAIARLKRAPAWAVGAVRHTFADPLIRYTALDPRAARFSDDLLRGSPMWVLGDTLRVLTRDLDALSGSVVRMNGQAVAAAVALNGGVARGTLRIFETLESVESATLAATDVVVLPETLAELSPVAGILTLGEGNALSHVQLLARNFGIPNVAIDQGIVDLLRPLENTDVILAVDNVGNVVLSRRDDAADAFFASATGPSATAAQIEVPVPNLEMRRILALEQIGRSLSGKVVGPKAANLGELNRLFPGRVAPALAVPFGIYDGHLREAGLSARIRAAFAKHASGDLSKTDFDAELAEVRRQIAALTLNETTRAELIAGMRAAFGEPGTYGVFVRSDTNVEDLPQFTGAGLNETVPHVVGLAQQIGAVPRVWSSVLSPRALAWRASVLKNPDQIFASVLLMKSVPSTKSGVLVTANLIERGRPGLTASTAWGVGGAVAGESAESVVIYPDEVDRVSEAKSPYQRVLDKHGGVALRDAPAGPVLTGPEIEALRDLAKEVDKKYAPVLDENGARRPWDIEFGFVDGELTLFQIRPLVERGIRNADALIRKLHPGVPARARPLRRVPLDEPVEQAET